MGHSLNHPTDLDAWHRWHAGRQRSRRLAQAAIRRFRPPPAGTLDVLLPPDAARVLVCVEASHSSVINAVAAPLDHLSPQQTGILCPVGWEPPREYAGHRRSTLPLARVLGLPAPRAVLAAGHYSPMGAVAHELSMRSTATFYISQHGALTPFAPPLPPAARLLSWSDADAAYWSSGRTDVTYEAVGSQLLWRAAQSGKHTPDQTLPLTYLGQGHAAEIARTRMLEAAWRFCHQHDATYRPHPSERDKLSRLAHQAMRRTAIRFDTGSKPLATWSGPVVSVFSTGVLEMAARGVDAWVDFPRPPAWLGEFWERYGMSRFGGPPTPAPAQSALEPARRIAEILTTV